MLWVNIHTASLSLLTKNGVIKTAQLQICHKLEKNETAKDEVA